MATKILVADDETVARRVLSAFLAQSGYEMEIVEDGESAFRALTRDGAPRIAILDWTMPDISGVELCTRLRAQPLDVQPYVIILSGRKERTDIAAALNAGANDYITKPFNIVETQARLRVAERAVQACEAARHEILELQAALCAAQQAVLARAQDKRTAGVLEALEMHQIDTIVAGALRHCGLNETPRRVRSSPNPGLTMAAASLLLPNDECWLDLLLEMRSSTAMELRTSAGRTCELEDFVARLHTALRDSVRSVLRGTGKQVTVSLPLRVPALGSDPQPAPPREYSESHHYQIGKGVITLVVMASPNPVRRKLAEELRRFDVLAKAYPPATTHVPFVRGGVALDERLIAKLHQFVKGAVEPPPILVHSPSPLALHYQRNARAIKV